MCTNLGAFSGSCRTRANRHGTVDQAVRERNITVRYDTESCRRRRYVSPGYPVLSLLCTHVSCTTVPSVRSPIFGDDVLKFTVQYCTVPPPRSCILILYCKFLNSRRRSDRTRVGLGPGKIFLRDPYRDTGGFDPVSPTRRQIEVLRSTPRPSGG